MKTTTKTCKICGSKFTPTTNRQLTCSLACSKKNRYKLNENRRERMVAAGSCRDCDNIPEHGHVYCAAHNRLSTIRKHVNGKYVSYYFGSKLSPNRKSHLLKVIKDGNQLLRENWTEALPWLEKNYSLWAEFREEPTGILYNYHQLQMVGSKDEPISKLVLGFNLKSKSALEDLVIAKIDAERGF